MNIPKKLKVGALTYEVKVDDFPSLTADNNGGMVLYVPLQIYIRNDLAQEFKERVFLHEMFHTMFNEMGVKEHNEELIDGLAGCLHAIIKNNPNLFVENLK